MDHYTWLKDNLPTTITLESPPSDCTTGRKKVKIKFTACGDTEDRSIDSIKNSLKKSKGGLKCHVCNNNKQKSSPRSIDDIWTGVEAMFVGKPETLVTTKAMYTSTSKHIEFDCEMNHRISRKINDIGKTGLQCNTCVAESRYHKKYRLLAASLRGNDRRDFGTNSPDTIDAAWIETQMFLQYDHCTYTGWTMTLDNNYMTQVSVDRMDNSKPHTIDNCILTVCCVNLMKHSMGHSEFLAYIQKLIDYVPSQVYVCNDEVVRKKHNHMTHNRESRTNRIQCNVDFRWLKDFIAEKGSRCIVTGITLDWDYNSWKSGNFDRIDSNGHYEDGNIELVLKNVNYLKSDKLDYMQCRTVIKALMDKKRGL